ncbi:MAG: hypothetical protein RL497_3013 [Pseudomonadota bacterium]|jgi:8-oxo-dGTP diphosphatase
MAPSADIGADIPAKMVSVVVGVILNPAGEVLLARRAAHQHQGGLWEFPGGKLEPGEPPLAGLWRELHEELGIHLITAEPLIQIRHHYPDKSVLLDVYRVSQFSGQPQGREGQPLVWASPATLVNYPLPAANRPIVQALNLPNSLTITGQAATPALWLERLQTCLETGARLILARPQTDTQTHWPWQDLLPHAFGLCEQNNARLIMHAKLLPHTGNTIPSYCHGLHLTAATPMLPLAEGLLRGMSCHNPHELTQAAQHNCHYALLSPILTTPSHPSAPTLGWSQFAHLCQHSVLPVYALGGMTKAHTPLAQQLGGQGVAGIGGFWG